MTEWRGSTLGRAILSVTLLLGWCITGPPALYIADIAAKGPRRFNVESVFVMAEIYALWCVYFFLRSFSQRPMSVWEHVGCLALGWFLWSVLGPLTHSQVTVALGVPQPLDDSTYMLLFLVYVPWIVVQYLVVVFMRPVLRLDGLVP